MSRGWRGEKKVAIGRADEGTIEEMAEKQEQVWCAEDREEAQGPGTE